MKGDNTEIEIQSLGTSGSLSKYDKFFFSRFPSFLELIMNSKDFHLSTIHVM